MKDTTCITSNDDSNEVPLWDREETPVLKIPITPPPEKQFIQIAQYGSDDDRWGIFSCVWDGGLGLNAYLRQHPVVQSKGETLVIDLGAGTGIVGIGMAVLGFTNVVLTDLKEAQGLLIENASLNPDFPVGAEELDWGEKLPNAMKERLESAKEVLIVGADIIYRQNLFDPLLSTLEQLLCSQKVKCIFATQSTRAHLEEFYLKAAERGFAKSHLANVLVPQGMSDDLPRVVPASNQIDIGVIHILELTRAHSP